jgi:ethanolaminephosphotransferase
MIFRLQTVFLSKPSSTKQKTCRILNFFPAHLDLSPTATTLTTFLLSGASFCAQGNNNAISSVDLSNAYNGISGYNITLVGLLVFVSNWAAPIYWALFGILLLGSHGRLTRHFDPSELDSRDWVAQEREYLVQLAEKEKEGEVRREDGGVWRQHVSLMTFWTAGTLGVVMLACAVLRQHLFVWSVFSPKFLMQVAWAVPFHLGVTVGLGGVLWWVGGW